MTYIELLRENVDQGLMTKQQAIDWLVSYDMTLEFAWKAMQ